MEAQRDQVRQAMTQLTDDNIDQRLATVLEYMILGPTGLLAVMVGLTILVTAVSIISWRAVPM